MNELLTMLDTNYKRLEYIQSNGTQWIDLGLTANQDTTIKCRASNINSGTQGFIGLVDTSNLIYGIGQQSENNYLYGQYHKSTSSGGRILSNIAGNDGVIRNFELRKNEFYIDNALIGSSTYFTFTTTNKLKLFTLNPSSSISSIKMYNAQVLDGNMNLLRNMIPVLRKSDNEIGMLDLVEGKFYPNAGTGKFTANLDTMYALIQGTPTVQDGRVSGFSSSNYIYLSSFPYVSKDWELVIKANTTYNSSQNQQRLLRINSYFQLQVSGPNLSYQFYYGSEPPFVFNNSNTDYPFVKLKKQGDTLSFAVSSNGTTYENISQSVTIPVSATDGKLNFGYTNGNNWYGIIDLNRSYIKIDDTKYKLQAVVGYTVVGSPTITDGVVSGFSGSDYLQINNANVFAQADSWEIMIKKSGVVTGYLFGTNKPYAITFTRMYIYLSSNSSSWDIANGVGTGQSSEDCFLRIRFTGTQYIYDYSIDTVNWTTLATVNSNSKITNLVTSLQIGIWRTSYYATGSIDLNNTYIKINNKLWFNGLEA